MALPRPIQNLSEHARWLYPLGVVVLATVLGQFFGLGLSLLVVAGGTLVGSIWLIWSSLQGIGGDAATWSGSDFGRTQQRFGSLRARERTAEQCSRHRGCEKFATHEDRSFRYHRPATLFP